MLVLLDMWVLNTNSGSHCNSHLIGDQLSVLLATTVSALIQVVCMTASPSVFATYSNSDD